MSTTNDKTPIAAQAGVERPSTATIQAVNDWLWLSPQRETVGLSWSREHVRDAARMIEAALARSQNTQPSGGTNHHE